jgi:hypothetical protein
MPGELPGELLAERLAVLPGGDIAEVIITERVAAFAERLRECYARWHAGQGWSAWQKVTGDVFDVSITPDARGAEPAALISAVVWVPSLLGAVAVGHDSRQLAYFQLTASGITSAGL